MNATNSSSQQWLILNSLPHIGPVGLRRLLEVFNGDPHVILASSRQDLMQVKGIGQKAAQTIVNWRQYFDLDKECRLLEETGTTFLDSSMSSYPVRLKSIYDAPIGLYQLGNCCFSANKPSIAIVGSRRTSIYGMKVARQFAQRLASMGFCIISGLARGVDTAAHEGALQAGGDTIAVLGNGIDIIYPPENLELYRNIRQTGCILTEFCFGRRADRQTFPMRNRIVSGLSDGVLVVESDYHGGSMITARFAGEQGRQVYAVPGRIDQSTSRGCHRLIKEGAIMTTSVEDILDDMKYRLIATDISEEVEGGQQEIGLSTDSENKNLDCELDVDEKLIVDSLKREAELTIDELSELTQLPVSMIGAKLMMLELKKLVLKQINGAFSLKD